MSADDEQAKPARSRPPRPPAEPGENGELQAQVLHAAPHDVSPPQANAAVSAHPASRSHADRVSDPAELLRIITSSPASSWALAGPIGGGKTTLVDRAVAIAAEGTPREAVRIGGLLSRSVWRGGEKIGYEGWDCLTREAFPLAVRKDAGERTSGRLSRRETDGASAGGHVEIGRWRLLQPGIDRGRRAIVEAGKQDCGLIVIDEFGPLECRGEGLRPAIDAVWSAGRSLLVIVREQLVAAVCIALPGIRVLRLA